MKKIRLLVAPLTIVSVLAGCGNKSTTADSVVYGNIITMDDNNTIAEAIAVKNKKIIKVGSKKEISKLVTNNTKQYDYEGNYVYPGFLDAHTHTMFAGNRAIGQANVSSVVPPKRAEYKEIIQKFINDHPEKDKYLASGWAEGMEGTETIDKDFLDEVCKDKPLVLNTCGGHSVLLNSKALEYFGVDQTWVTKWGTDLVHVDAQGNPNGYICENPAIGILKGFTTSVEEAKEYILNFQDFAFQNGFTGVSDAGVELMSPNALQAHVDLQRENKLKMRTYAYMMVKDNYDKPKEKIEEIANFAKENNGEYFKVVGAKVFLDGVLEARTAWTLEDYTDVEPGEHYTGLQRFKDKELMTQLIAEAGKNNLAVHSHSIGDGATRFFMDCIVEAQKISGNKEQRNAASHLQLVSEEDIQKFADTDTIAVVPPLWSPKTPASTKEISYIGDTRFSKTYPIESFIEAGAKTAFHSDYPVSPSFSVPMSVYTAAKRNLPEDIVAMAGLEGKVSANNENEKISRKDAVLSMTKNVAYMWHQEDNLGSLEVGKIGNMSVFDVDLINGDIDVLPHGSCVATIVDGEEVYNAGTIDPEEVTKHLVEMILELIYDSKWDWDDDPEWEPTI